MSDAFTNRLGRFDTTLLNFPRFAGPARGTANPRIRLMKISPLTPLASSPYCPAP